MRRFTILLLALGAGCTISDVFHGGASVKTSGWLETGEVRKPREEIARLVRELLLRQGFAPPEFENDTLETSWDIHLSPRFREGYRTKVETQIVASGSGGFNVFVRSTMEINNNDQYPNILERADWIGAGASEKHKAHIADEAVKLQSMLKFRFFGLNP